MKVILALMPVLLLFLMTSCKKEIDGSGNYITEERKLSSFNQVESAGDFKIYIVNGNDQHVKIHAEDNIMPHIVTSVSGSKLRIYTDDWKHRIDDHGISIYISVPVINNITLAGSGVVTSQGILKTDGLTTVLSGSGSIDLSIDIASSTNILSGSGTITLHGNSLYATNTLSGSGKIHGYDLHTKETVATVSGSGNCEVNVSDFLRETVSGSGDVIYIGQPQLETHISGSGTVHPL